ncbi:hypothetical protein BKA70DRAFT_1258328 [Coprinopsis sp. MPI-PUGE-AT-0042]|nr:hypothetical protein BKA70DRAFT_1258328 [Coprinopsis sp. MPI-PUGE-AT-0042]
MNPPDPAAVKALLEQLRVSQVWQEIQGSSNKQEPANDAASSVTPHDSTSSSSTVAELLAQLKKPTTSAGSVPPVTRYEPPPPLPQPPQQAPPTPQPKPALAATELKQCTFQNALPLIARLGEDPSFSLHSKRATMIGAGITAHEAAMLQDAYQRELRKFDEGRVLNAWDGLISKQQTRLESLGVPNMFVGSHPQARQKQAQIMQVLVSLLD